MVVTALITYYEISYQDVIITIGSCLAASSDFLKKKKIPEFGSVNLDPAGSVSIFLSFASAPI
jgi:hypothetical protein